jgi:hypothetical protein
MDITDETLFKILKTPFSELKIPHGYTNYIESTDDLLIAVRSLVLLKLKNKLTLQNIFDLINSDDWVKGKQVKKSKIKNYADEVDEICLLNKYILKFLYYAIYTTSMDFNDMIKLANNNIYINEIICKKILEFANEYQPSANHNVFSILSADQLIEGCEINQNCLIAAYFRMDCKMADQIVNNKFEVNSNCFKIIEARHWYYKNKLTTEDLLKNLIGHGYRFSNKEFIEIIQMGIYIDPLDHNINFNKTLFLECYKSGIIDYQKFIESNKSKFNLGPEILYPFCEKNKTDEIKTLINKYKIVPDVICLEKLCENQNTPLVKLFVDKCGVVPTIKCLELSCKHKTNTPTIQFLIGKGLKPNITCLANMLSVDGGKAGRYLADIVLNQ